MGTGTIGDRVATIAAEPQESTMSTTLILSILADQMRAEADAIDATKAAQDLAYERAIVAEICSATVDCPDLAPNIRREVSLLLSSSAAGPLAAPLARIVQSWQGGAYHSALGALNNHSPYRRRIQADQAAARAAAAAAIAEMLPTASIGDDIDWQITNGDQTVTAYRCRYSSPTSDTRYLSRLASCSLSDLSDDDRAAAMDLAAGCRAHHVGRSNAIAEADAAAEAEASAQYAALLATLAPDLDPEASDDISLSSVEALARSYLTATAATWDRLPTASSDGDEAKRVSIAAYRSHRRIISMLEERAAELGAVLDQPSSVRRTLYERRTGTGEDLGHAAWTADYEVAIGAIGIQMSEVVLDWIE